MAKGAASNGKGPLSVEDLKKLEEQIVDAGKKGVTVILDKHFDEIEKAQDKYALRNEDLISSSLALNREVAKGLREKVQSLQGNLRAAINKTAEAFETRAFKSVEDAISSMKLSRFQQQRVERVFETQQTIHLSYQSIRFAVQVFVALNRELLTEIEGSRKNGNERGETDLLLKNAILVYELANTIVSMLDTFQLEGKQAFEEIKKEVLAEIEKNRAEDAALLRQCEGAGVDSNLRDQTKSLVRLRDENRNLVNQAWHDQQQRIAELESQAISIKKQVANLKLIRDNAKNQLGFLQILTITQMMKHNVDAVQGLLAIKDLPLAPLTPDDVCRLLNIQRALPAA